MLLHYSYSSIGKLKDSANALGDHCYIDGSSVSTAMQKGILLPQHITIRYSSLKIANFALIIWSPQHKYISWPLTT